MTVRRRLALFGMLSIIVILTVMILLYDIVNLDGLRVPLRNRDCDMIVNVQELGLDDKLGTGEYSKRLRFDGSVMIEFRWRSHVKSARPIEVVNKILLCGSNDDVTPTYEASVSSIALPALLLNLKVEPCDFIYWGDESSFVVVNQNGVEVASVFVARKASRLFYLFMSGTLLDERETAKRVLLPHLEAVERY